MRVLLIIIALSLTTAVLLAFSTTRKQSHRSSSVDIVDAANQFISLLNSEQKEQALFSFEQTSARSGILSR